MIDLRFVGIIVFMVVGGFGVYLAFASALREWPFNPRKLDVGRYEDVKRLYLDGLALQRDWGERTVFFHVLQNSGSMQVAEYELRDKEFAERSLRIIEWKKRADQSVVVLFGESACRTFITEPEVSLIPPDWQRGDQWFINWNQIAGRLAWLRRWLLEQDDL
jgi:hypothetical protein